MQKASSLKKMAMDEFASNPMGSQRRERNGTSDWVTSVSRFEGAEVC